MRRGVAKDEKKKGSKDDLRASHYWRFGVATHKHSCLIRYRVGLYIIRGIFLELFTNAFIEMPISLFPNVTVRVAKVGPVASVILWYS